MIRPASTFAEWEERARMPVREPVYLPARRNAQLWNLCTFCLKVLFGVLMNLATLSI